MKPFESFFAREFDEFIEYRKQLGLAERPLRSYLLTFDRYLGEQKQQPALLEPMFFLELRANLRMQSRSGTRTVDLRPTDRDQAGFDR